MLHRFFSFSKEISIETSTILMKLYLIIWGVAIWGGVNVLGKGMGFIMHSADTAPPAVHTVDDEEARDGGAER